MDAWQIADTVSFITKHKATRIGLQFPDHLLKQSAAISLLLKEELTKISTNADIDHALYIMADTTFAPCCVDEISAQHVNAEVIVHYGWTCCSPTNRIPVLHVLGKQSFDIQLLKSLFFAPKIFKAVFASFKKILVLHEPHYQQYRDQLLQIFKCEDIECIVTEIHNESSLHSKHRNSSNEDQEEKQTLPAQRSHFCGFRHQPLLKEEEWHRLIKSDEFSVDTVKQNYAVLYIGNDEFDEYAETPSTANQLYLSLLANFGSCFKFISYNPSKIESYLNSHKNETENKVEYLCTHYEVEQIFNMQQNDRLLSKMLMYRYSLIEKIKQSDIIGIVCATLVVDNYLDIIRTLKQSIKNAGKKSYMLSVGKINQAKLGNFSEIDIFVVITCPMSFHYLLPVHQQSFFKNLVTPFDVMMALNEEQQDSDGCSSFKWTGMYSTSFNDVLRHSFQMGGCKAVEKKHDDMDKSAKQQHIVATLGKAGGLVKKDATDYMLEKRTWKGVEVIADDLAPSKIEQGLTGIASQYEGDFK